MTVNVVTAALPALLGNAIGIAIPYWLFMKVINPKYGELKKASSHGRIKYWCWVATFIVLAFSLIPTLNELFFISMNDSQLRAGVLMRSSQLLLGYTVCIWLLGGIILLATSDKTLNDEDVISSNREVTGRKNIFIPICIAITVVFVSSQFSSSGLLSPNEKTFEVISCQGCGNEGCKESNLTKGFKVDSEKISVFFQQDGIEKIQIYPTDADMKCSIVKENNFAFQCSSFTRIGDGAYIRTSRAFDGKHRYEGELEGDAGVAGGKRMYAKEICLVK